MITVKELIEQLAELPPDLEVLVNNPEAETFRAFEELSVGFAEAADAYSPSDYQFYPEEHYKISDSGGSDYPGDNVVVLWPA